MKLLLLLLILGCVSPTQTRNAHLPAPGRPYEMSEVYPDAGAHQSANGSVIPP